MVIATNKGGLYATELHANNHIIIADEPEENGGKNRGPSPGDFLRMSLASCTAITLRMCATRKNFDVKEIQVNVSSEQIDGETYFNRTIHITGHLDQTQHERMLKIANACPVHKVLTHAIHIETSLLAS